MMNACKGLRHLTGSYEVVHGVLAEAQLYYQQSQCSLNKALERACLGVTRLLGASTHRKFWRLAKQLCNTTNFHRIEPHRPHAYLPCMMSDLQIVQHEHGPVWELVREAWVPTPRTMVAEIAASDNERRSMMHVHILEAIVQHQLEFFPTAMDYHVLFLALTFARRTRSEDFSATVASHVACMAVRYEMDGSRAGTFQFKGLRRWRNTLPSIVADLALTCIWAHGETPRHHQLWHFRRLIREHGHVNETRHEQQGIFLLLIGVMHDHVFASIPPEHAADAVYTVLFTPQHPPSPRQTFDLKRLGHALTLPRSAYMHILFPELADVPVEVWHDTIRFRRPSQ